MTSTIPFRAGGTPSQSPQEAAQFVGQAVLLADVSEFQPDIADATYLRWSKAIVIRAAYGDRHDDQAWYAGTRRSALHKGGARFLGIYQYLVAGQSGAAQAQAFHALVGPIQPGEVFIADFEEGTHAILTDWYNEMLSLYGAGIHPYLWTYAGLNFGAATGVLPVEWLADYTSAEPPNPHTLWQFTDAYSVPGVGTADCSVYHGSIDQLATLAYQPAKPAPPGEWTYEAPRNLKATGGHTSVKLTWEPPAGAPVPPDHYMVYIYRGTDTSKAGLMPSYPRSTPSSPWQGGSIGLVQDGKPVTEHYTAHVVACGPHGSHVKPYTYASVQFTTG